MSGFARLDREDLIRLESAIDRLEKLGIMTGQKAVKTGASFFATSAAKATKPGTASHPSRLANKYKFRPVVRVTASQQRARRDFTYYDEKTDKFFRTDKDLSRKQLLQSKIKRVTYFVEGVNNKGAKYYIPVNPNEGRPAKEKRRIPNAGAAKMGWYWTKIKLGERSRSMAKGITPKVNMLKDNTGNKIEPNIIIGNNVDYITKISPGSARVGLSKASRKMNGFLRNEENKMQAKISRL